MNLTLTVDITDRSACLHIAGELDYLTEADLLDAVFRLIAERPALEHLHLDFSQLSYCGSAGLSALLLIRRRTSASGIHLHLDHRPSHLDRILEITCTLDYLTTPVLTAASTRADNSEENSETGLG
jgi:anti-anti-sigma factor